MLSSVVSHRGKRRNMKTANVLFVCTGNICRSPTAEAVFRTLAARAGLAQSIAIDSAGTHDYQVGEPPDPRAIAHARRRGYELPSRCARQIEPHDFARFDWILAMDRLNLEELEVPDPYNGKPEDFERVLDLTERGAVGLLDAVRTGLDRGGT